MQRREKTIRLTGRPPVKIDSYAWRIIGSATGNDAGGAPGANDDGRADSWSLAVRRHADGRVLVYGALIPGWASRAADAWFGGQLMGLPGNGGVSTAAICAAVEKVGAEGRVPRRTIRECLASLPAEAI